MNAETLVKKVEEYKEIQAMIDELKQEADGIVSEIKADMTSAGIDEVKAGVYKVRYKEVVSNRFDAKGFKAVYSDLYSKFSKPTVTKRFSIA